jgi:NadR type nicotinamide-nucleotide adenylyltransferase
MLPPKKIVITGPESTGKSTLCEQLAMHYGTVWVPEYARAYLLQIKRPYNFDDLLVIAKGQLEMEDKISNSFSNKIVFIDTDMYVMKVWCEFVFGRCHSFILDQIVNRKYDGYLLCNTDLPWVADELREYPDLKSREQLYFMYKDLMINQSLPWTNITGSYDERFFKAISFVENHLLPRSPLLQ